MGAALLAVGSCSKEPAAPEPIAPPPIVDEPMEAPKPPPFMGTNVIDAATHAVFFHAEHTPTEAPMRELCRRLHADLVGRYPTKAQVARDCDGKTVEEIVDALRADSRYLVLSHRHWRDRLDTDDAASDWRYLRDLYAKIDRLHRGQLRYEELVVEVLAHPAFTMTEAQPADRVRAAFRAFLGREATDAEAADLASLYRPWIPTQEMDPDFTYTYRNRSYVYPVLCQPLLHCKATMLGGGTLDLRGSGQDRVAYEDLETWQLDQLKEIGRVFARQAILWEAAADAILNRLLGWSDGGRNPREPGIVLPEVRQALAEYLAETGDYVGAEKMVLTSWLYRQSAIVEPDGLGDDPAAPVPAIYTVGPLKAATPEVWLDSALNIAIDFGTWDPRYTDGFGYFLIQQAVQQGNLPQDQLEAELLRLHRMQDSILTLRVDEMSGMTIPDFRYVQVVRLIGGAPGFQAVRTGPDGVAYAYTQESLAELLCQAGVAQNASPGGDPSTANILTHQMNRLFARDATSEEITMFRDARDTCTDDCSVQAAVNASCVALLGSAEMLFY